MRPLLPIVGTVLLSSLSGFGLVQWLMAKPALSTLVPLTSPVAKESSEPSTPSVADSSAERIESALALGKKLEGIEQEFQFYNRLKKLDARELTSCADRFAELVQRPESADLCEAWLDCWLEVDSPGALRWLERSGFLDSLYRLQPGSNLSNILGGPQSKAFAVLARKQPEWMREYVNGQKADPKRDAAVYQLVSEVARQDATKAKELFDSFTDGANRSAAVQGYVAGLAASDVRTAFATALGEPAGPLRNALLETTFLEAGKRGVGTVSDLLDRIEDPVLRRDMAAESALALAWHSREDPLPWLTEEAKRKVPSDTKTNSYDRWPSYVGQALMTGNRDPAPVMNWAAAVENDPDRKLLKRMLVDWCRSDPEESRRWLTEHPVALEGKNSYNISSVIVEMARKDAAATWAWAESLPPGSTRDQVRFQAALGSGSELSFAEAVAAYHSIAGSDNKGELAKQLTSVLVKLDPTAAAQWALQMEQGSSRSTAITTVAEQWSQNDPRAAAAWIETLRSGPDRDKVVREYAAKVVYADPAIAKEWVQQIDDPKVRADAATQVFQVWNSEDPVAPRAWLRSLPGVDEKWRADFLQRSQ